MSNTDWSGAKRARVEVAQQPRRILFNDCDTVAIFPI